MSDKDIKKIGAGGFWNVIDEKSDETVVKQLTPLSCAAAVGEMLMVEFENPMTQREIIDIIGEASTTSELAKLLNENDPSIDNKRWHGLIVDTRNFDMIVSQGSFGAVLRDGSPLGHLVLVEKGEEAGLVFVKDPWEGTSYQMLIEEEDFFKAWNGEVVLKWKL